MISEPSSLMVAFLQLLPHHHRLFWLNEVPIFSMAIEMKVLMCKQIWQVLILCNDCSSTSRVKFHIFGHKCSNCNSYNTRVTQKLDSEPQSSSDS